MAARCGVFLIVYLIGTLGQLESPPEWIVWNVGQGQWVSLVSDQTCWHLDMGGEFAPWDEIQATCRRKTNKISLSHWDMDHIGFVNRARGLLPDLCLWHRPLGPTSPGKMAMLAGLSECADSNRVPAWADPKGATANAKSWVIEMRGVLAPGDSPRNEEKIWVHHFSELKRVKILILGHHGSRTSTSPDLLQALPNLRLAISSARKKRYGHPHAEVMRELDRAHVPLLRTEEWGTIHIRL